MYLFLLLSMDKRNSPGTWLRVISGGESVSVKKEGRRLGKEAEMVFSHLTRIVAVLALMLGAGLILMGYSIARGELGPTELALKRYTTASTTGEVIDKGTYYILVGLAFGTLAEIGLALRKGSR
jgi:hypothetical protein